MEANFGEYIRKLRTENGLTLTQLGAKLGIDSGALSKIETGKKEFDTMKTFYAEHNIPADVFDFSKEIPSKLALADFAISRSGASTLWELCAATVPALFIPFPHAAANHQYFNAKMLADQKLALICSQNNAIDPIMLLDEIKHIDLSYVSKNLSHMIQKDGAKEIVDMILHNQTKEK
mgnify:FL=1